MPRQTKLPVCVQYRWSETMDRLAGWCIVKHQPVRLTAKKLDEIAGCSSVETLCGMCVIYPAGVERCEPTCAACQKAWRDR